MPPSAPPTVLGGGQTVQKADTGTTVGSSYTMLSGDHRVTVRIVGEVFGPGKELRMYASPATLAALSPGGAAPGHDCL